MNDADAAARELNLAALVRITWEARLLVVTLTAFVAAASIVYALLATKIYTAEIVVTETRDSELGSASGLMSQLGGLASVAGLNLGSSNNQSLQSKAVLQSRYLSEVFVTRYHLQDVFREGEQTPPTLWKAVRQFRTNVFKIREDVRKGTTTVTIEWRDPATAARWANDYIALANELLRKRAIDDATRNIDYLNKQIATTNVVELQKVLYQLVESQTKTLMLASGRAEYAFTVVDPAVPAEQRSKPMRTLIVIFATALGGLFAVLVAIARHVLRVRRLSRS